MAGWRWESFAEILTSNSFWVSNPGSLATPISEFSVSRNDRRHLELRVVALGEAKNEIDDALPGTVRSASEFIEFEGVGNSTAIAHGLSLLETREGRTREGLKETRQHFKFQSLTISLNRESRVAYIIDWVENIDNTRGIWTGVLLKEEHDLTETITINPGSEEVVLRGGWISKSVSHALKLVVADLTCYICTPAVDVSEQLSNPAYIVYVGQPDDSLRKRIRDIVSFCLGSCLIYLGSKKISSDGKTLEISAQSANTIGGRIFELPSLPPSPLGTHYDLEISQTVLGKMVNAIYDRYDHLHLDELMWMYWYGLCAPVHMAAAHFGAAIEALEDAYIQSTSGSRSTRVIADRTLWKDLKTRLDGVVRGAELDDATKALLHNKISNLNQRPRGEVVAGLLSDLGIQLSKIERTAWARRNDAAHGRRISSEDVIEVIRETKILRVIFCRMLLSMTSASSTYYDYYTIGLPIRRLEEPIPTLAP